MNVFLQNLDLYILTYERAQEADGVTIACSLFYHVAKKVTLNGLFCF